MFLRASADSRRRALFYAQLRTLLEAGLPLVTSLEQIARTPPASGLRPLAHTLLERLRHRCTFAEAFQSLPRTWATDFDVALIHAGEQAGRLDQTFHLLARHHEQTAQQLTTLLHESTYPLLVLHVALFVAPLPAWVQTGNLGSYLISSVGVLILIYALIAAGAWSLRPNRPRQWRALVERMLLPVPMLGSARSDLALARLASSLESLLAAGIVVTEAWPMAARASGSPLIEQTVALWAAPLASGTTPAELVAASGVFPELFVSAYSTGEISGQLDSQLGRLAQLHESEGFRKLRVVSQWSPRLLYGLISLWIILQIFTIAGGYASTLQQLLGE